MLIEPVINKKQTKPTPINKKSLIHWCLMLVLWFFVFVHGWLLFKSRSGQLSDDAVINSSIVFTLSLFFCLYVIGVTIFLVINFMLNRRFGELYNFFIQLNSLVISAFGVLWLIFIISKQ
jgi:hypothetical protein